MAKHDERPATVLARGPAKPDDIDRARRDVGSAEVTHAVATVQSAAQTLQDEVVTPRRARPADE